MITTAKTDAGMLWEQESAQIWESLQESKDSQQSVFNNLKLAIESLKKCMKGLEDAYNTAEGCLLDHVGGYLIDVEDLYDDLSNDFLKWKRERS